MSYMSFMMRHRFLLVAVIGVALITIVAVIAKLLDLSDNVYSVAVIAVAILATRADPEGFGWRLPKDDRWREGSDG